MRSKWFRALVLVGVVAATPLPGQNIPEDEIHWRSEPYFAQPPNAIHVKTNVVQVPVVVRDEKGKPVGGLKKSDFQLYDNGHQVEISSFSIESKLSVPLEKSSVPQTLVPPTPGESQLPALTAQTPRYIALFFDDLSMREPEALYSRKAAESFVRENLAPGDKIGIFTTSTTISLDFTDNRQKLLEALGQLLTHRKAADSQNSVCPLMNPYQASVILQFKYTHSDALDLAMKERGCSGLVSEVVGVAEMKVGLAEQYAQETLGIISDVIRYLNRMPGHRMLVLASSGFLTQTLADKQDKVIDEALNANVIINTLDAKGLVAEIPNYTEDGEPTYLPPGLPPGKWIAIFDQFKTANREVQNDPLALLAEGTGGKFFHNRNDLDVGLRDMVIAPDVAYMLTFSPLNLKANGSLHSIKVKLVNSHGMNIQARPSYMAPDPKPTESEHKKRRLDNAVLAMDSPQAIPTQVTTAPGTLATGEHVLKVEVHVDSAKLPFQAQGDRQVERLIFITALFDAQNHFLSGVQGIEDLRLKKETLAAISNRGLDVKLSLQAPPGSYRLRQVVQETGNGRITSMSRMVEIQ
jgi:VWFA-related protein